jgi:hypothetical protein
MKKHRLGMIVRSSIFTLLTCLTSQAPAFAQVIFSDDFSQTTLNTTKWGVGNWQIGRAYLNKRPTFGSEQGVAYATLSLNTYNPSYPGKLLQGSEIYSIPTFAFPKKGQGLQFEARVRVRTETRGLVTSFFTWGFRDTATGTVTDEIDFEYLTNLPTNQVLLTTWNDWDYRKPVYNDGVHHSDAFIAVGGFNRKTWSTLQIRWLKDRIEWYVNGVLARSTSTARANDPMHVHFNFWAAASEWGDVYDAALQPALTPDRNVSYLYDIDYVRVSRIP